MPALSRDAAVARALATVEARADRRAAPVPGLPSGGNAALRRAGRLTVAFHPDRSDRRGLTAAEGLLVDRAHLPQWVTGASGGSRSAVRGGSRAMWERRLFGIDDDVLPAHRPVYGALDLLNHRHGGSPAFGSCHLVLRDDVRDRCTLTVGDSHRRPDLVGTFDRPDPVLRGLVEQASRRALLGQALGVEDLAAVLDGEQREAPRRTLDDYLEVQVHGGVALSDVAAIVADPSFRSTAVEGALRRAAAEAGATFGWHAGTVVAPEDLTHDPVAVDWQPDEEYLARLVDELARLAAPSRLATAASIGRLVAGERPGPPSPTGDEARSRLQRVKHLWRLTYLLGHDADEDHR